MLLGVEVEGVQVESGCCLMGFAFVFCCRLSSVKVQIVLTSKFYSDAISQESEANDNCNTTLHSFHCNTDYSNDKFIQQSVMCDEGEQSS